MGSYTCTHTSCYAVRSSLALAHMRHAKLWDLLLHLHTCVMLSCEIFSCACTHTSRYAVDLLLHFARIRNATLWDLLLHLHAYVMLRCGIFSCTCTRTSCYAVLSSSDGIVSCTGLVSGNLLISTAALELQLSKRCPRLAASETCARHLTFNFVNVTFVQTVKSLFNMKSRLLVLRSLKKPVPRVEIIDVSVHDSAKIS